MASPDVNWIVMNERLPLTRRMGVLWFIAIVARVLPMMTSSNGSIFRVTGPLCGSSPVPVNSPHKGQWRGALMFSLICVWTNDWVHNHEAGDLRRSRVHYDVNVMANRNVFGLPSKFLLKQILVNMDYLAWLLVQVIYPLSQISHGRFDTKICGESNCLY